ncbi:MAG: hypothetical protein SO155_05550 [Candidatus Ventricola sp.]|nr:hypothetical protein [Candidatus Ventricola sp.]
MKIVFIGELRSPAREKGIKASDQKKHIFFLIGFFEGSLLGDAYFKASVSVDPPSPLGKVARHSRDG